MNKFSESLQTFYCFYRATLNAGRSSHDKRVRLSVGLSVCLTVKHVQDSYTIRKSI